MLARTVASTPSTVVPARTFSTASARFSSRLSVPLTPRIASRTTPASTLINNKQPIFSSQSIPRKYSTMADHGGVIQIKTDAEYKEKVLNSKEPIVVDCFASWCGPCKTIAPKVEEFSVKYPKAKFYQIDVDSLAETASDLSVRAMPTFVLYKDGQRQQPDVVGANPSALEKAIQALIA